MINIAIDLTARTKSQLEESVKQIRGAFPVSKECPYSPDPLFAVMDFS